MVVVKVVVFVFGNEIEIVWLWDFSGSDMWCVNNKGGGGNCDMSKYRFV